MSFKPLFSRFLAAAPERLHLAAHSHHLWPDTVFEAQARYVEDTARLADHKWELIFGDVVPRLQARIAAILTLPDPASLAFAPNTHEFVRRLLSCLPTDRPARVLTTDSEFHSVRRQLARLEEDGLARVTRVTQEPTADFPARFAAAAEAGGHDLVLFSQVFFNSGYAVPDLAPLVAAVPDPETLVAIDGYHGFMALPTDLSAIAPRAFYIAGGYKYAMAGEGACFLHVPPGYGPRPRDTGWYAAFGALAGAQDGRVPYGVDGSRFLGSTFDPSGLYRMLAVLDLLAERGIDVPAIHAHVLALLAAFAGALDQAGPPDLARGRLLVPLDTSVRGHFLTYRTDAAGQIDDQLRAAGIIVDHRDDRLRFGFGLYHDLAEVPAMAERVVRALAW
ncbi:aminotransferase [Mycobacterium sp. KBS0706]|uniref:kynureninase/PvdN C-terminal domain-containing protein n=1 Tax=Mycobacterium sp. KBS0706 TaxID=2578109 RepID=UPI00110F6D0F|nr:aminotransferase [Mycobacterium sp. KBS0706]TSD88872.1 aminotransferase [Mycobacterium sp. KBS0706]